MPAHVKTGDTVIVISGNDKGTTGEVVAVNPKHNTCIVKGVNVRTKHVKPNQQNQQGGVVRMEMPIHISNVNPFVNGKSTRVRFEVREDGAKARVSARDGSELHVLRAGSGKPAKKKTTKKKTAKKSDETTAATTE